MNNIINHTNYSSNWLQFLNKPVNNNVQIEKSDINLLSKETNGFTTINGTTPPGSLTPTQNKKVLLDIINEQGQRVLMVKAVRKVGTRVGIHLHKFGGYTLILSGEMTDFVEGIPNKKYGPNSGYYMPPNTPMSAGNLGNKDVELIDIFIGQPGEPYIEILEPDWNFNKIGRFSN